VIEGRLRKIVHRVPGSVIGQLRLSVRGDQCQVGGGQDALPGVADRIAARFQLLQVGDLGNVDLGGEMPARRCSQPLLCGEQPAGEDPGILERLFRSPPQQHGQPLGSHLEDDSQRLMAETVGWHTLMVERSGPWRE
jgi:hypothetical protein